MCPSPSARRTRPNTQTQKTSSSKKFIYILLGYYVAVIAIRSSTVVSAASNNNDSKTKTAYHHASEHENPLQDSHDDGHHTIVHTIDDKDHHHQDEHISYDYDPDGSTVTLEPIAEEDRSASHTDSHGNANDHLEGHGEHEHGTHDGIHVSTVDFAHVSTPFIISAWILCACFAKIGFHVTPKLEHLFPESCLLIVIGIIIGLILFYSDSLTPPLTPSTFFLFMLPPIILDAGYFMPNKMFFNNLGTILLFAVVATLWNTFTIGLSLWGLGTSGVYGVELPLLQTLLFSSLVSAVDPVAVLAVFEEIHVNEVLYIVVFGESLLNDAVTVVLYHIFEGFSSMGADKVTAGEVLKGVASFPVVALGGTAIGIIWGFVIGFTTRFTNHVRIIEPLFVFLMAYLSYLNAEIFHMSGILAITFCGITMKNYVEANISQKSHTTVKYTMKMMSSSAETIIFVFLGVATIHDAHYWSWWFVIATIVFCSVYRIIGVIIFTYLANHYRLHKLGFVDQFVMSYGGLRGAVAFALVLLIEPEAVQGDEDVRRMFVTTTITVVFFTVFVQGMTIKPLVQWLKVARSTNRKETISERIHEKAMDHAMAGIETLLGQVGHHNLRERFKKFDRKYIRPYLTREVKGDEPKILETYARLILEDALVRNQFQSESEKIPRVPKGKPSLVVTDDTGKVGGLANITPEALAALIKDVLVDTMSDANIASIVQRRKSSARRNSEEPHQKENAMLTETGMQNLLGLEFSRPSLKDRRLSYSRHSVNETVLEDVASTLNARSLLNHKSPVKCKKVSKPVHNGNQAAGHRDRLYKSMYTNQTFNFDEDLADKSDKRQFSKSLNYELRRNSGAPPPPKSPIYTISGAALPWKIRSGSGANEEIRKQEEFPRCVNNKDDLMYASPTNTYLDGITGQSSNVRASDVFGREEYQMEPTNDDWLTPPHPPVTRRSSTPTDATVEEEPKSSTGYSSVSSNETTRL